MSKINITTTLNCVLNGCETWYLVPMEEHRLRVFQNKLMRKTCWPKRKERTGGEKTAERGTS
jgi:hypothetical protein